MVHTFFEERLSRLNDIVQRFDRAMSEASIPYEVVGGLAVYYQVERAAPDTGRLTRDIDVLVHGHDVKRIATAAEGLGFVFHQAADQPMLVDAASPSAPKAIHLIVVPEPTPEIAPERLNSAWIASVAHLLRMKLTSYRLRDRVHIQDMDNAGLTTPKLEAQLPEILRLRLEEIRRTD